MEASRRFVSTSRAGPSESMRMDATWFFLAEYYFLSSHHSQVLAGFFVGVALEGTQFEILKLWFRNWNLLHVMMELWKNLGHVHRYTVYSIVSFLEANKSLNALSTLSPSYPDFWLNRLLFRKKSQLPSTCRSGGIPVWMFPLGFYPSLILHLGPARKNTLKTTTTLESPTFANYHTILKTHTPETTIGRPGASISNMT